MDSRGDPPPPAGFYDQPSFLPPGELVRWQREEAAIRADEQREESERQERADARRAVAEWNARQSAIARGLPWSPERPFEHEPSIYAKADAVFAVQDAQQRDADRRALRDAGLEHLLGDLPVPPLPPSPGDAPPTPGTRARPSAPGPHGPTRLRPRSGRRSHGGPPDQAGIGRPGAGAHPATPTPRAPRSSTPRSSAPQTSTRGNP